MRVRFFSDYGASEPGDGAGPSLPSDMTVSTEATPGRKLLYWSLALAALFLVFGRKRKASYGRFKRLGGYGEGSGANSKASTKSNTKTRTATEVRSPTSTNTDAYTSGNITVTGGAGAGETRVYIQGRKVHDPRKGKHASKKKSAMDVVTSGRTAR